MDRWTVGLRPEAAAKLITLRQAVADPKWSGDQLSSLLHNRCMRVRCDFTICGTVKQMLREFLGNVSVSNRAAADNYTV